MKWENSWLCETAVRTNDLPVYPCSIWTGQEGDYSRDVFGLTKALQWSQLGELVYLFLTLAFQKEVRAGRPGGDRIDRHFTSPQLVGQDVDKPFYTGF